MILRIALFVMMALGLAGFGTAAWIGTRPPAEAVAATAEPPKTKILVTARALRAGSLIKPEDLVSEEVPQAQVPFGASPDTAAARAQLFGAMVKRSLGNAEPVLPGEVMHPGDHGFLAAVLAPNTRAVTVGVDAISGSAGLIWPGDKVDLILTQTMDSQASSLSRRFAAETVLSDVRVIATDQQIVQGASTDGTEQKAARTVTLEVTSSQAERVSVASRLGHLSLVVRAAEERAVATAAVKTGPEITWAGDVSPALNQSNPEHAATSTVRVFHGATDGKEFHF